MRRRTIIKALAGAGLIPVVGGCDNSSAARASSAASTGTAYSLRFDASSYTTLTKTVSTGSGTRTVTAPRAGARRAVARPAAGRARQYLRPAATKALGQTLTAAEREAYLAKNTWISWSGGQAGFTWDRFLEHVGSRSKGVLAFDAFDLSATENSVYGDATHNARHFTLYSLRHATGNASAQLADDLPRTIAMMNPLYHLRSKNPSRARHWWTRTGTLARRDLQETGRSSGSCTICGARVAAGGATPRGGRWSGSWTTAGVPAAAVAGLAAGRGPAA